MKGFIHSVLLLVMLAGVPPDGRAQAPAQASTPPAAPSPVAGKQEFHVHGRVATVTDEAVPGAEVQVDIGVGPNPVRTLETNLKGEFETDYSLNPVLMRRRGVSVVAIKAGYAEAFETADFASLGSSWTVELVLRESGEKADQLPLAQLILILAPRLQTALSTSATQAREAPESAPKVAHVLDHGDYAAAATLLAGVLDRDPNCVECRTLLGLALLGRGSWSSAMQQVDQAIALSTADQGKPRKSEPFLVRGVIEDWRQNPKKATDFLLQALQADPGDALTLQELGRTLFFEGKMAEADSDLTRAIQAGAPSDAHLLRARALLAESKAQDAQAEMNAYLGGRTAKDLPFSVRAQWAEMVERLGFESSAKTQSVVDRPVGELTRDFPELKGSEPGQSQDELSQILLKVGEGVEAFFRDFPNTSSREEIREEHVQRKGKTTEALDQRFQYLCLAPVDKQGSPFVEYRTEPSGERASPRGLDQGFMLTQGFAAASLPFHPAYQADSAFRYLGRQTINGRQAFVVAFAQRPERVRLTGSFRMNQVFATTLSQGLAWIDTDTYKILRMRTDLLYPLPQVYLQRETTEIQFEKVQFKEISAEVWLPRDVTVTVEWRGKILRNTHHYSEFKVFDVETTQRLRPPRPAPEAADRSGEAGDRQ